MPNPFRPISEGIIFLVCGEWLSYETFYERYEKQGMSFGSGAIGLVSLDILSLYLGGYPWTETALTETREFIEERIRWFEGRAKIYDESQRAAFQLEVTFWKDQLSRHDASKTTPPHKVEQLIQKTMDVFSKRPEGHAQSLKWQKKLSPYAYVWDSAHQPEKTGFKCGLVAIERVVQRACKDLSIDRIALLDKIQKSQTIRSALLKDIDLAKEQLLNAARRKDVEIHGTNAQSNGNLEEVPIGFLARDNYQIHFPNNPKDEFSPVYADDMSPGKYSRISREIEAFAWKNLKIQMNQIQALGPTVSSQFGQMTGTEPTQRDELAEWIFQRLVATKGVRENKDEIYTAVCARNSGFNVTQDQFDTAYKRVFATKRGAPLAQGWPLQVTYQKRYDELEASLL